MASNTMLLYQTSDSRAFRDYFKAPSSLRTGVLLWIVDRFPWEWASALYTVTYSFKTFSNFVIFQTAPMEEGFSRVRFPEKSIDELPAFECTR